MTFIFGLGLSLAILFLVYSLYKSGQRIRRLEKEMQALREVMSSGSFDVTKKDLKYERQWALSFHREERRFTIYHSDAGVERDKQAGSLFYVPAESEKKTFWPFAFKTKRHFLNLPKRHKLYGEILSGIGLGALYFVLFLTAAVYGLISGAVSLLVLFLITLFGGYFSFVFNSKIIIVLAVFGGLLTPFLLSAFGVVGILNFFNYLVILNAGILSLSLVKGWYDVSFGTFIATVLVYLIGLASASETVLLSFPFFHYALAGFLLFFSFSVLCGLRCSEKDGLILALFALNPAFFLFISIQDRVLGGSEWLGFLSLSLSALYLVVYFALPKKAGHEAMFRKFSLGISSVFFVFFVPIQLEIFYITIAWALQATFLFLLARLLQSKFIDLLAKLLFVLVFLRLLIVDTFFFDPISLILNLRFGLFLVVMFLLFISYVVSLRLNKNEPSSTKNFLLIQIYFLGLWSLSLEVLNFLPNFFLPFAWLLWALLLGVVSFYLRSPCLRIMSYAVFVFSGVWILLTQGFLDLSEASLVLNSRTFSFLSLIILGAVFLFFLSKSSEKRLEKDSYFTRRFFFLASAFLLFWLVTRETVDGFARYLDDGKGPMTNSLISEGLVLSSVWMVYALFLLLVGFFKKVKHLPACAAVIFVLIIGKTFIFDAVGVDHLYRLLSFLGLGGALLVVGYVYVFFSKRLNKTASTGKSGFLKFGHR